MSKFNINFQDMEVVEAYKKAMAVNAGSFERIVAAKATEYATVVAEIRALREKRDILIHNDMDTLERSVLMQTEILPLDLRVVQLESKAGIAERIIEHAKESVFGDLMIPVSIDGHYMDAYDVLAM